MAVNIADIQSVDWSPKVGAPGEVVEGNDDIIQCVTIILTTRKGTDPHRPTFGCDAWLWIDKPVPIAVPNIVREVIDAINTWEQRIQVSAVKPVIDVSHATITLTWIIKESGQSQSTEVYL